MKLISISMFSFFFLTVACHSKQTSENSSKAKQLVEPKLQTLLDSAHVNGSILIYELKKNLFWSNDFARCDTGFIPASTFKIPNSLIALETGIVEHDRTLIPWEGWESGNANWDRDLTFKEAFHYSCVPCYRSIARRIGAKQINHYLKLFDYGKMDVDSTNIDLFWLAGDSKISQQEQIQFLKKFYLDELPITERTAKIAKRMMQVETKEDYRLLAKTGRSTTNFSWYVGYLEHRDQTYFFATNIIESSDNFDPEKRKRISLEALRLLNIID